MKIDYKQIRQYFDLFNEEFDAIRNWAWDKLYPEDENGIRITEKDEFRIDTRGLDTILTSLRVAPRSGRTVSDCTPIEDICILIGGYALADNAFLFYLATGETPEKNVAELTKQIRFNKSNPKFEIMSYSEGVQRRLKNYAEELRKIRNESRS